jgi:hypothetical protein
MIESVPQIIHISDRCRGGSCQAAEWTYLLCLHRQQWQDIRFIFSVNQSVSPLSFPLYKDSHLGLPFKASPAKKLTNDLNVHYEHKIRIFCYSHPVCSNNQYVIPQMHCVVHH